MLPLRGEIIPMVSADQRVCDICGDAIPRGVTYCVGYTTPDVLKSWFEDVPDLLPTFVFSNDSRPGDCGHLATYQFSMTTNPTIEGARAVVLQAADCGRLEELCGRCTDFFELVHGRSNGAVVTAEILAPLPEKVASGVKVIFGIEQDDELVGVTELLSGFPASNEWYVGLLVLQPDSRGSGLGTAVWRGMRAWMEEQGARVVRLVVQKQNASARMFWEKQRFVVEEEIVGTFGALVSPAWRFSVRLG